MIQTPLCECESEQTIRRVVFSCSRTKFEGNIEQLRNLEADAKIWPGNLIISAFDARHRVTFYSLLISLLPIFRQISRRVIIPVFRFSQCHCLLTI